jgi:tetratricopeptide (TPR) repeat protein
VPSFDNTKSARASRTPSGGEAAFRVQLRKEPPSGDAATIPRVFPLPRGKGLGSRFGLLLLLPLLFACARERPQRILVLGFDGLDPEAMDLLLSEGKLPHFARLRREGAYGRLKTFKPTLSPILWTTIATGKTPDQHGIGHFVARDPATGRDQPVTSDMRHSPALWNLFSEAGRSVGVLGWWATYPAEKVNGFIASDRLAWHFLFAQGFEKAAGGDTARPSMEERGAGGVTHPPELETRLRKRMTRPDQIALADLAPYADVTAADLARPFDLEDDLQHFRWVLATLRSYRDVGLELWRSERPDLMMVYFEGTDSTAHLFGHLFRAQGLAGELALQQRRFGHAVESVYEAADRILGDFLATLDGDTTLVVLSDHGFELGVLPDDPSQLRDMRRVSERFHRDHGVLYFHGAGVRANVRLEEPTLLDIAPTLLALSGIPPATDMPGKVLRSAFVDLDEPERRASYEEPAGSLARPASGKVPSAGGSPADQALLEHLKNLGYLSGTSSKGDRNLAAIAFENRDYRKAAQMYQALVAAEPEDAPLRASLAGALGALGRYDEAIVELDRSLALDPLNPEGHHNRGAALERLGRGDEAIASYREAVRYRGDYAPSLQALERLGATASTKPPASRNEREAAALAEEASNLARRGDYADALARLAAAQKLAPRLAQICQYESNVAYLAGDRTRAVRALERCLTLEPDNALFRTNLERLRSQP